MLGKKTGSDEERDFTAVEPSADCGRTEFAGWDCVEGAPVSPADVTLSVFMIVCEVAWGYKRTPALAVFDYPFSIAKKTSGQPLPERLLKILIRERCNHKSDNCTRDRAEALSAGEQTIAVGEF